MRSLYDAICDAGDQLGELKARRPTALLATYYRAFIKDILTHAGHGPRSVIQKPILSALGTIHRLLPSECLLEGPWRVPVEQFVTEQTLLPLGKPFLTAELQRHKLYTKLMDQLVTNGHPKAPKTVQQYLHYTPLINLARSLTTTTLRPYRREHWCMIANSGAGKSSFLFSSIADFLRYENLAHVVIDPHGKMADWLLSLEYWQKNPEKLVVIEPKDIPPMNLLYAPTEEADRIAGQFAYMFASKGQGLSTQMNTAFRSIVRALSLRVKEKHTTMQDVLDLCNAKSVEKSGYKEYIDRLPEQTKSYFYNQFFAQKESRDAIATRVQILDAEKTLWAMFNAPGYDLDFWKWLHTEKKTVIVTARGLADEGLFMRYVISQCIAVGDRRKELGLDEDQCSPVRVWVDEAQNVIQGEDQIRTITAQLRKFGIYLCAVTQQIDFIQDAKVLMGQSNVLISAQPDEGDARVLAQRMGAPYHLVYRAKPKTHLEYVLSARGHLDSPIVIQQPYAPWTLWKSSDNRELIATKRLTSSVPPPQSSSEKKPIHSGPEPYDPDAP